MEPPFDPATQCFKAPFAFSLFHCVDPALYGEELELFIQELERANEPPVDPSPIISRNVLVIAMLALFMALCIWFRTKLVKHIVHTSQTFVVKMCQVVCLVQFQRPSMRIVFGTGRISFTRLIGRSIVYVLSSIRVSPKHLFILYIIRELLLRTLDIMSDDMTIAAAGEVLHPITVSTNYLSFLP